jgi:orotidine-5'-phosphate decarboxylase
LNESRIIVSLDYPDIASALDLTRQLDPARCRVKVGKELYTRCGPVVIENLLDQGFQVFLDLKFHDIPNTVSAACKAAAELGVWMINIHACGGRKMIHAARDAIDSSANKPLLICVTVLTSLSDIDLKEIGMESAPEEQVLRLAQLSEDAGADGVVCSAKEASLLRKKFIDNFLLITPGIRPAGSSQDDQSRVLTPKQAIIAGSDYLVIGRPITQASDPLKALEAIEEEVKEAMSLVASR